MDIQPELVKRLNSVVHAHPTEQILTMLELGCWDDVAVVTSFQKGGVALLHLLRNRPQVPVYFVDTGMHFVETLAFKNAVAKEWDLDLVTVTPEDDVPDDLHRTDPDRCCCLRKVRPLAKAQEASGRTVWLSAVRAGQTPARAAMETFMLDRAGNLRVHPLLHWTDSMLERYTEAHSLPVHPLYSAGYGSIGCSPPECTRPGGGRDGRWHDVGKTECGIHENLYGGR